MYIKEGGNVFKDADGAIATTRINQTDVKPTVQWLEQLTGLPLMDNMLGSTGQKPTSGDLDLAVDPKTIGKDDLVAKLTKWAESHGFDPKEWIRKSGVSVHFKAPITGREDQGYIQTDFMFVETLAIMCDSDTISLYTTNHLLVFKQGLYGTNYESFCYMLS